MGILEGSGGTWVYSSILVDKSRFRLQMGSKFGFSGFGPGSSLFLAEQVQSLSLLEGFEWVRSSVLVDEPAFG